MAVLEGFFLTFLHIYEKECFQKHVMDSSSDGGAISVHIKLYIEWGKDRHADGSSHIRHYWDGTVW